MKFKNFTNLTGLLFPILLIMACEKSNESILFNGKSFDGWEGSNTVFRIEDEAIVGGSLVTALDESYYLCTERKYGNFELTLSAKFVSPDPEVNGGISFRAKRVPDSNEVMGYQADIGYIDPRVIAQFSDFTPEDTSSLYPLWGCLVDENRPNVLMYPRPDIYPVIIHSVANNDLMEEIINQEDWNEIQISAIGSDIEIKINGVSTAKYSEEADLPTEGCICLQAHSGGPYEIWYKNISLSQIE